MYRILCLYFIIESNGNRIAETCEGREESMHGGQDINGLPRLHHVLHSVYDGRHPADNPANDVPPAISEYFFGDITINRT